MGDVLTTGSLTDVLTKAKPQELKDILQENMDSFEDDTKPFSAFMRKTIREKGLKQQDVFLNADLPEGYGYKLISGEKHTKKRDIILRICIASKFNLKETQKALKLYGMSPLYAKFKRDAALIIAINSSVNDPHEVDALLSEYGMEALSICSPQGE